MLGPHMWVPFPVPSPSNPQRSLGVSELYLHARPHVMLDSLACGGPGDQSLKSRGAPRSLASLGPQALSCLSHPLLSCITYRDSHGKGGSLGEQGWHNPPSLRKTLAGMF